MDYSNYDDFRFLICPLCGYVMKEMSEKYNLNGSYEDKWFECTNPKCEYCIDGNYEVF